MRIIFSRKGFDSTYGGCPSPIVEGRPISLPIPTRMPTQTTYGDLGYPIPQLVSDLTKGRLNASTACHLDPDIDRQALVERDAEWNGAFGQLAQAQQHLANQRVSVGDLFLFWGLFREVESRHGRWTYVGRPVHAVFGWLQIGSIWSQRANRPASEEHVWLARHPHAQHGWSDNNTIYIARHSLELASEPHFPGFGVFSSPLVLTAPNAPSPSIWQVPEWLHPRVGGTGLTYHPAHRWQDNLRLRAAARGQEFVADATGRADAASWLKRAIRQCLRDSDDTS